MIRHIVDSRRYLSLILTVVRARSKTLLPCIVIHFINNAVASLMILLGKDV